MHANLNYSEMSQLNPSALESKDYPRHRWYYFKEGFSPAFVEHIIKFENRSHRSLVMDPFSGSGTTGVVALQNELKFSGIETNPFLHFVGKTKMQKFNSKSLALMFHKAEKGIIAGGKSPLLGFSTFSEKAPSAVKRGRWLFNSKVLNAFQGGINAINGSRIPEAQLVKLCLVASAMDVSNAAKDGKCLRFKNNWTNLEFDRDSLLNSFDDRSSTIRADVSRTQGFIGSADLAEGDCRKIKFNCKFNLCITSPPYLNSFDYTDVYRPELFLGGFVKSPEDLYSLRHRTLRSHIQTTWINPVNSDFGIMYEKAMKAVLENKALLWDDKIPRMIQAYFEDIQIVLRKLYASAAPDASAWIVVSTSAYAGVEIPVDLIIAEIATKLGWYLREIKVLRYLRRISGQQWRHLPIDEDATRPMLRESAIVLDFRHN